jgi:hypothetical protein
MSFFGIRIPTLSQGGYPAAGAFPCYGGERQYYYIKSRMNGLVLDIDCGNRNPRTRVIMWTKKNSDNQLWYDDYSTGTIRSKMHDLCLDIEGGNLIVNIYHPGNPSQQWERADPVVRNRQQPNKVFDISGNNRDCGATVCSWDYHGGQNQQFEFEFIPGAAPIPQRRDFFIVSDLHGKVIDISGANAGPGAPVICYSRKPGPPSKNQLWYMDPQGLIHSALNDMVLCGSGKYY